MFRSICLTAVLSAALWPVAARGQWLPVTQSDTEHISRTGNVGIGGPAVPTARLTVRGNTSTVNPVNTGIFFTNSASSNFELSEASNNSPAIHLHNYKEGFIRFQIAWVEMMRMLPNGNIGVRTPTPAAALHVSGITNPKALQIDTANGLPVFFRDMLASEGYGSGTMLEMSGNSMIKVSDLRVGNLGMPEINSTNAPLLLNADSDYGVQVGTDDNPRDLVVKGNIAAKFQDLAEWVPTTADLAAGTVVVLDPARSNHVLASARPYDTAVAGVVSPQPGIILGEAGPSKALIATTGRVRVRVDATAHPIAIGDLLVTSDKPGVAMKSIAADLQGIAFHRPGTVLGKALEPLPAGTGEILVLLSLQ
jgi:hypothetical protein